MFKLSAVLTFSELRDRLGTVHADVVVPEPELGQDPIEKNAFSGSFQIRKYLHRT
jgi:hypothetical protein